jgi:hypothetical protein
LEWQTVVAAAGPAQQVANHGALVPFDGRVHGCHRTIGRAVERKAVVHSGDSEPCL